MQPLTEKGYQDWLNTMLNKPTYHDYYAELMQKSKLDTQIYFGYRRLLKGYDLAQAITGYEGTGKSTLAIEQAMKMSRLTKVRFDLNTNVLYNPTYEQATNLIRDIKPMSSIVIDEAIRILFSRLWNDKEQKKFNQLYTLIREKRLFVNFCIPAIMQIDSNFRSNRILLWTHVFARGKAGVFAKSPNPFTTDPFNIIPTRKLIDKQLGKEQYRLDKLIKLLKVNSPNFITWYKFNPLKPKVEAKYKELKHKFTIDQPAKEVQEKEQYNSIVEQAVVDLYESSPNWTMPKISKNYKLTEYRVREIIKKARGGKEDPKTEEQKAAVATEQEYPSNAQSYAEAEAKA